MQRLQELGYDVGSIPVGLLEQLVRLVYRTAIIGEGEIDLEELNRVVEMSSFMLKQPSRTRQRRYSGHLTDLTDHTPEPSPINGLW